MFKKYFNNLLLLLIISNSISVFAYGKDPITEKAEKRSTQAISLGDYKIKIDGSLDDHAWKTAVYTSSFIQTQPNEGALATEKTEIAFYFDDDALYIGARMYSSKPEDIIATVARRDQGRNSERIIISLDTFFDNRTSYSFYMTAGGVRGDYFHPRDESFNRDYSYDPVWIGDAKIDSLGWTAEMRIPFSQLRFDDKEEQVWGLNINRYIPHKNEDTFWVYIPRNETGWASRFGLLEGIGRVKPARRLELTPYVASSVFSPGQRDSENPFVDNLNTTTEIGGDIKLGIGQNFTVDATINPDFGQVESDPAVVNLGVFEVVFDERRPFFSEGNQLLRARGGDYFFSRRVGAAPAFRPGGRFVESISNTPILGAAKITGRMPSGLSIGALFAATASERAEVLPFVEDGQTAEIQRVKVEPLTTYSVLRMQQEFGKNASTAGFILTGMQRDLGSNQNLITLRNKEAYSGALDWNLRFKNGTYELSGDVGFSHIEGSKEAILRAQRSSARFFQRPDANHVRIDSNRTSLTGYRAGLSISKNAGRFWLWNIGGSIESPEFEINDMGLLFTADDVNTNGSLTFRENNPGKLFFNYRFSVNTSHTWNNGGIKKGENYGFSSSFTFHNFWSVNFGTSYNPRTLSDNLTRGGPLMGSLERHSFNAGASTNRGLKKFVSVSGNYSYDEAGGWSYGASAQFRVSTTGRLEYTISPRFSQSLGRRQFLQASKGNGPAETFGDRFLFSDVEQSTIALQARVNYSLNPNLSIEFFGEPFVSSGNFKNPGILPSPRSFNLRRLNVVGTSENGNFLVEENGNVEEIRDPDFLRRSFISNLVIRYEWIPGSTFFLVWQQNRVFNSSTDQTAQANDLFFPFSRKGDQTIAVKFTYWIPAGKIL